jgi:hypothetical protein
VKGEAFTRKVLVFSGLQPLGEEVKAKKRKPPDARDARALMLCLRLAAGALTKRCFRSLPHYCEGRANRQRWRVYSRKRIEVSDKNKSLNHQKPGAPKGLPIFALAGRLCGVG